ncbi:hypothetical protein TWF569_007637 [Orbilia oligospora]|nr:hypothetical protein TWF706_001346 [Orbilia oligospora]KAF3142326.1 hypothetical protein TWF569_007637 [Orbilia oligospora]
MARFLFSYTLFASLIATAFATKFCKAQPNPSCPTVGARALQCSSQVSKLKLKRTTCTAPSTTVTKTATIKPSTTKTVSITLSRTIVITNRSIATRTITTTIPTVKEETITTTETFFTHGETTSTSTITETAPVFETCKAAPSGGAKLRKRRICTSSTLSPSCSCHLTVTKRSGKATVTKTIRLPTSTKIITKTVSKTTTTISFTGSTYTQTVTVQSTISTFTTTESVATTSTTSTSTGIAETTQIAPYSPCEDPYLITRVSAARPQGLTWDINPSDSLSDCCRQCYHGKNCAYFARAEDGMCTVWFVTPEAPVFGCATDSCDWGWYREEFEDGEFSYGPGRCGGIGAQR